MNRECLRDFEPNSSSSKNSLINSVSFAILDLTQNLINILERNDKSFLLNGYIGGKSPRFTTRAMFLDLSRNFYGYESVIELLSIMGPLELNQLHLRNVLMAIQINERIL